MMTIDRSHYKDGRRVYYPKGTLYDTLAEDEDYERARTESVDIRPGGCVPVVLRFLEEATGAYTYHRHYGRSRSANEVKDCFRQRSKIIKHKLSVLKESLELQLKEVNEALALLKGPIKFQQWY